MVLVDTSVWVEHIRNGLPELEGLLRLGNVVIHELVMMELSLWTPPNREIFLADLSALPYAKLTLTPKMIDSYALYGRGCGYVDSTLFITALFHEYTLWTLDKRLNALAKEYEIDFEA